MRRIFNRERKQAEKTLDSTVLQSKEYTALGAMNIIMNYFDLMEKVGYDPLHGDELYIHARAQCHAFMLGLMEKLESKVPSTSMEAHLLGNSNEN